MTRILLALALADIAITTVVLFGIVLGRWRLGRIAIVTTVNLIFTGTVTYQHATNSGIDFGTFILVVIAAALLSGTISLWPYLLPDKTMFRSAS